MTRQNKLECLHLAKTFQSDLTIAGSTRSLPKKEASERSSNWVCSGFALNSKTWLERVSKGKPSSWFGLVISNKEKKKFYKIFTWSHGKGHGLHVVLVLVEVPPDPDRLVDLTGPGKTTVNLGVNRLPGERVPPRVGLEQVLVHGADGDVLLVVVSGYQSVGWKEQSRVGPCANVIKLKKLYNLWSWTLFTILHFLHNLWMDPIS